jgi:GMP synthase (glutamine-hydrolysing)
MNIHYLQHVPFEGLGSIEHWVTLHGHQIIVTKFHAGDSLPAQNDFNWLVILGDPMNIYEELKYLWLREENFIRKAVET